MSSEIPVGMTDEDSEFIEHRSVDVKRIEQLLGVQPKMIKGSEPSTYENLRLAQEHFANAEIDGGYLVSDAFVISLVKSLNSGPGKNRRRALDSVFTPEHRAEISAWIARWEKKRRRKDKRRKWR